MPCVVIDPGPDVVRRWGRRRPLADGVTTMASARRVVRVVRASARAAVGENAECAGAVSRIRPAEGYATAAARQTSDASAAPAAPAAIVMPSRSQSQRLAHLHR